MKKRKWREIVKFSWETRRPFVVVTILLGIGIIISGLFSWAPLRSVSGFWATYLDPIVGLGTLLVALSVWRGEVYQDWRNSLPKRLTVVFRYGNHELMRCDHAKLSSEADIRLLGQQIGMQMADVGGPHLKFRAPNIQEQRSAPKQVLEEDGGYAMVYEVVFDLTALPETEVIQSLKKNQGLLWAHPFDKDAIIVDRNEDGCLIAPTNLE